MAHAQLSAIKTLAALLAIVEVFPTPSERKKVEEAVVKVERSLPVWWQFGLTDVNTGL